MRRATTCVECIWGAGGRGKPRNARGRGWVGALPDRRRMGQIVVGPQQMQNVTATGRKDGGAAMGKSGDDGDSAIVSDGERGHRTHPSASACSRPRPQRATLLVTFISHSTKANFKVDMKCQCQIVGRKLVLTMEPQR